MTRAVVVTTTINNPKNLIDWAKTMGNDDEIIVTGDIKTPHDEAINTCEYISNTYNVPAFYIHPDAQTHWASSDALGWNCIQRRNIAFLEAARLKPEIIITVDDDNFPLAANQIDHYYDILTMSRENEDVIAKSTGWYNIGEAYSPRVMHRGFPLKHRHQNQGHKTYTQSSVHIGVTTSLWVGDPDIDAIERIANNPQVGYPQKLSVTLDSSTWCPFNSQATAFHTALLPLYMMWPRVGRFDDIFPGYVVRTVLDQIGYNVHYGYPLVSQTRNEHDLLVDLRAELLGYGYTSELTDLLRNFEVPQPTSNRHDIFMIARMIYKVLVDLPWLQDRTKLAFEAWLDDIEQLAAFPNSVNFTMNKKEN